MALQDLHGVLLQLKQTHWKDQQSFEKLVDLWPEIVGSAVAAQTRPVRLTNQGILYVTVSSGAWAQNLAFERIRLLRKVNALWHQSVKDIYFSTRDWYRRPAPPLHQALELKFVATAASGHTRQGVRSQPKDARDAFARWSVAVQNQSKGNVPCPQCQCPTPLAELKRRNHCSLCLSRSPLEKHRLEQA